VGAKCKSRDTGGTSSPSFAGDGDGTGNACSPSAHGRLEPCFALKLPPASSKRGYADLEAGGILQGLG